MARPAPPGPSMPLSRAGSSTQGVNPSMRPAVRRDPIYTPTIDQLHGGPANRHILALRSGIPDEVDWALPRLVTASHDLADRFNVSAWLDAAPAFMEWPERWLEDLQHAAALKKAFKDGSGGEALGVIPRWSVDPAVERRATESLLIMRNASCNANNAKHIARPQLINFLTSFFALPHNFTLDVLLQSPEPVLHIFVILQSVLPYMTRNAELDALFLETIPAILVDTRDAAVLALVIPLIVSYLTLLGKQAPINLNPNLSLHLLHLLTLAPPSPIFEYTLDLLVALTIHSSVSLGILNDSGIAAHVKTITRTLDHGAQVHTVERPVPGWTMGSIVPNPASTVALVEEASKQRALVRANVQKQLKENRGIPDNPELGTRPPQIDEHLRRKLMAMKEPERSVAWMHESFVYSAQGQVLQVDFWHAYREFFNTPERVEPMLSAAEVIKNVAVSFPGTGAKVINGGNGQKFVIAGLGFRPDIPDADRNGCRWEGCQARGPYPSLQPLIEHVRSHLAVSPNNPTPPARCHWKGCSSPNGTLSHMLTHLPLPRLPGQPIAPLTILSNLRGSETWIPTASVTRRSAPRLPPAYKIRFEDSYTPVDEHSRSPRGAPFLAALLLRNLARSLRNELDAAAERDAILNGDDTDMDNAEAAAEKRKLADARYGLPIPDSVLQEQEDAAMEAIRVSLRGDGAQAEGGGEVMGMTDEARARARCAFLVVEDQVGEVVMCNRGGLGAYLGDCWGW